MNNTDRADSNDEQSTDMDTDRDDDIGDRSDHDDTAAYGDSDNTAAHGDSDESANNGRRDDIVSNSGRADSGSHDGRDHTANSGRRDDIGDRSRRDSVGDHSGRDDTGEHSGQGDTAISGRRDDTVTHSARGDTATHGDTDTYETHERRNANDDHGYRDENANRHRRDTDANEANSGVTGKWLSPLIALLGLWMVAMALVLDVTGSHFWSAVLVGALLVGVGGYNYSRQANERVANAAIALIAVAAGLWLIAAPFVLDGTAGLSQSAYELWFYNHIAVGVLAVGLGTYSAYTSREHQQDTRQANA